MLRHIEIVHLNTMIHALDDEPKDFRHHYVMAYSDLWRWSMIDARSARLEGSELGRLPISRVEIDN